MLNRMRKAVLAVLAVCVLFTCASGTAESMHREIANDSFDVEVTVGYNGLMTYGKVMPIWVRIRNFGGDFEGILGINAYVSAREYDRFEREVSLPAGSEREFVLPVTVYARQMTYTAEILKDGEILCAAGGSPVKVVNPSAMLVGILSSRPQNLNNLNIDMENDVLSRYEYWQTIPLSADSFPEDPGMLKSFGLLVLDDLDLSSLSEKQRDTLDRWLRSGRVLICGGGASAGRNAAFFSSCTGLSLEGITTSDSIIDGLELALGRTESEKTIKAALAEYSGAEPLARDAEGRGLIWRATVGAGRIYTAAFEAGDPKLNSESLMHFFWQQLLINYDQEVYSSMMYYNAGNEAGSLVNASSYAPVEARSMMLPGVLIVGGMLVLICVLWWILKKRDLRQWMWLALPLTALLAAGGMLLLAAGSETNRPLAVIAENLIQDSTGAVRNYSGITVAAPDYGLHSYSMAGESIRVQSYDYVDYYDEEDENKNQEPDEMRTCYTIGGGNTVTMESVQPWQMVNLSVEAAAQIQGMIDGTIWMEEDGLHGEIVNLTDLRMNAGYVVTTYGYASVPALAPGEKADFLLRKSTFKDPQNPEYKDGCMYPESQGMYSVVYAAVGYIDSMLYSGSPDARERETEAAMINNAADILRHEQGNWSYGAYESALFLYSAKPENTKAGGLQVDGKTVVKQTNVTLLTAELSYSTVGRTGVVYRSAGMDVPGRVNTDENLMPTDLSAMNGKNMYYHPLNESPTFLFTIDGLEGVRVENLQVVMNSYYVNQAAAYALNVWDCVWEEIQLNTDIRNPARFLDAEGRLYIQFRNNGQDMYADISVPLINLEGRTGNAED